MSGFGLGLILGSTVGQASSSCSHGVQPLLQVVLGGTCPAMLLRCVWPLSEEWRLLGMLGGSAWGRLQDVGHGDRR